MSDFEAILLFIAIWIACGLIGVYWAGVLDRGEESGEEEAPLKVLFLFGPVALMAKDAIEFMNCRTYVASFQRCGLNILIRYVEVL